MPYPELRKGRHSAAGQIYLLTLVTADRRPYFSDLSLGRVVVSVMRSLHDEGALSSLAFVVMPDHVHWLIQLGDRLPLAECVRRCKGGSARRINERLGRRGAVWQVAYYDRAVRREEDVRNIARYIVANPIRAGLVVRVGDYPLWDATWL